MDCDELNMLAAAQARDEGATEELAKAEVEIARLKREHAEALNKLHWGPGWD